jgi:hypothetical protein
MRALRACALLDRREVGAMVACEVLVLGWKRRARELQQQYLRNRDQAAASSTTSAADDLPIPDRQGEENSIFEHMASKRENNIGT